MVRFCIFGAGQMGNRHARTLAEHPKAEVHSVCDLLQDAASGLAGRLGAIAVSDREAALADAAVDAVVITTPASSVLCEEFQQSTRLLVLQAKTNRRQ